MAERELIREHYASKFGDCQGFPHTDAKIVRDAGSDARIDGLRSYTVQTFRAPEGGGDFHFIEVTEQDRLIRICLPPNVSSVLAKQREQLAARARRINGRMNAARLPRPPKGVLPPQFKFRSRKKRSR